MAKEIERKFIVSADDWREGAVGVRIRQGYLVAREDLAVRVRVAGPRATLTVKAPDVGIARREFEYPIPLGDATEMLDELCDDRIIHKTRYRIAAGDRVWEVDEFHGEHEGLVLAEIELEREDAEVEPPAWLGREVTRDSGYTNAALASRSRADRTETAHTPDAAD